MNYRLLGNKKYLRATNLWFNLSEQGRVNFAERYSARCASAAAAGSAGPKNAPRHPPAGLTQPRRKDTMNY